MEVPYLVPPYRCVKSVVDGLQCLYCAQFCLDEFRPQKSITSRLRNAGADTRSICIDDFGAQRPGVGEVNAYTASIGFLSGKLELQLKLGLGHQYYAQFPLFCEEPEVTWDRSYRMLIMRRLFFVR